MVRKRADGSSATDRAKRTMENDKTAKKDLIQAQIGFIKTIESDILYYLHQSGEKGKMS
jgi:hypothetical protein